MSKKISADSDLNCTLSPPPSLTHVGDKHGTHYASTGDIRPDTTSQSDSSEAPANSNEEAHYHTALQMDQSSQVFLLDVHPDTPAHSDYTLKVHKELIVHEDTGRFDDTDVKELYQLFSDNEFRDSKINVASKNDSQDFDNSPRQISFGADSIIPDRLENDSVQFTSFDDTVVMSKPVGEERKKIKKTDNMDATVTFKTSSPITQLTKESDDVGLKHEDRIIDAGIHMKEMVESSGIDDFLISDEKELDHNDASEPQPQALNAKNSASPLITNSMYSSNSEERDYVPTDIDTENLLCMYSPNGELLSTVSQRSSSELPTPMQPLKGGSLQDHTLYTIETAGKESPSANAMPLAILHGVNSDNAALITPADDSSTTNSKSSALLSKDLACTVDTKMIYSSKKALSVRFSDDVMEIPPPDEFEVGLNDSHENAFPTVDADFDNLNIGTRPAFDSLDSMIDITFITRDNASSLNGLRVTGSVEMMKLHKEKMKEDQNCKNLEEKGFQTVGEESHLSALPALDSHFLSEGDKIFQQDFQFEQSSFITPHQYIDSAESHVVRDAESHVVRDAEFHVVRDAESHVVKDAELQSNEDDLSEEPKEKQFSYEMIQIIRNDMMESKPSVDEAESLDKQIESQGVGHTLDHGMQGETGEQSIKIKETVETFMQPHQGLPEDLANQIEIESTIERSNRHEDQKGFGEQPVEHEQVVEQSVVKHCTESLVKSVQQAVLASEFETSLHKDLTYQSVEEKGLNPCIESIGQFVQKVVYTIEPESELLCQEDQDSEGVEERRFKNMGECSFSCLLPALDSHSLSHSGKICKVDFQIEQSSFTTPQQYTDSVESLIVNNSDLQSKVEDKEDAGQKSIEPQISYALTDPASNDVTEFKLPIEEAERNTKSIDQQIELQRNCYKLDHPIQLGADGQSIKIEERGKTCLHAHNSSDENLTGSTELEHALESSNIHENHEVFGEQPIEHEKPVLNNCIESTRQSGQQVVQASEAEFELSFQEEENYQNVEEIGFKGIGKGSHSCLLPALDSHSVSQECKIFQQDFQKEKSSVTTLHQTTDSAELYFVKVMEQQSKEEKEIIGISMETQPSYSVIEGTSNDVIECSSNNVIELKPPVEEAEEKHVSIDYQIESPGASPKLDHLIQGGTGDQCIKTEETGEKQLQSHKSSIKDIDDSREIEHIERLDRHENYERFGEQPIVHDPVLEKSVGKLCIESTGQAAHPSESLRNWPPPLLETFMSLHEAAMKEPVLCPVNAVNDSASLKKVVLIDQLLEDGGTPLKNIEDSDVLSACTSDAKVTFANTDDSLSIRRSSLPSLVQSEHGQLNVSIFDDRTKCAEDCQDSNQGKHDEEHSVLQMVNSKKDVFQPTINITKLEEDLEPTLDISHFPGLKIKPRTRKSKLGPSGTGVLVPQDSLQKVIPPSQLLKMKQKMIVENISSKASSNSSAVSPADQKQNGIGTIKDFQTTNAHKEKGKFDSHKVWQSAETTLYSGSEGNDTQDTTNEENKNAIKEVPNSSSIEGKDSWQQLQTKPASLLDKTENVTEGGNTGKKSLPQLKTASTQTEGSIHQTSVGLEGQIVVHLDSLETKISKKEEGAKPGPSVSQDYDMSASKSGSESMKKAVEPSVHRDTQRIITGLTTTPCEGNKLDKKPNLTHSGERKPLIEDWLDRKTNDQKKDIADDMSGQNIIVSNESFENNQSNCTMPSRLPEFYYNKNIEMEILELNEGQDNTTNQQLKDLDSLERKGNADKLCGYAEVQNTFPSDLLPRSTERKENMSANDDKLMYTTPTSLVDTSTHCEEMAVQSSGYGEFQYTTPSSPLHSVKEKKNTEDKSTVYCELYTTPTGLFDKFIQSRNMSEQSPEYGEVQYTTPSGLFYRVMERNEGENKSPGYGEFLYTTPSRLLERQIQTEEMSSIQSPVYGEFQYTTPSGLLHRAMERNEGENRSPGYGELKYTTPSRLLERHIQREEMPDHSPGYGEFHYTTPSGLLHRTMERNEGENRSPGYGELKYTTPSRLLERHIQREEMPDHSLGYGEFHYTTPSGLLHRTMERNEGENRSPGYGELKYTTPSRLLERHIQREEMPDHSPGYGEFLYTTPSGLVQRFEVLNEGESRAPVYGELKYKASNRLLDRSTQSDNMSDQSPVYGEFQYTTPSGLLCSISDRNIGSDENKYKTPVRLADLDMKGREIPSHSRHFEESLYITPTGQMQRDDAQQVSEEKSPRYGKCYVTPSVLIYKDTKREDSKEKSQQSGKFQNKTPSQLLAVERRKGERDDKSSGHNTLRFSTPSLLLYQELLRRQNLDASSPGYRVPKQSTVKSRTEDEGYGNQEYTTPSQILEKYNRATYTSQSSPCLEYHYSTTPSQMLAKSFYQKKPENVTQGYEFPSNVSPSELFDGIQALENGLKYASEPLMIQMYRPYGIEYPLSDCEYRYSAPSRLLEVMDQRRPAEPMTSKASSSRPPHPGDHNKYNEQNVRIKHINPARFFQKKEGQARRSKASECEAFNDSIPLKLVDLDDNTRPSQAAVLRDCDLEGQEEEAILFQYEYDSYVDGSHFMSDNKVPATVQYPSTASFDKFYNKVSPAIPYSSTTVGDFQYKTPSNVLRSVKERYGGEDRSPGYGENPYTAPYRTLDRSTQTEKIFDQSLMFKYGPLSDLLLRVNDRKDGKDKSTGSGEIKYTGSAKVLDMDVTRREVTDYLPYFDEAIYTTPSGIIHREDANQAFAQISPRYEKLCDVKPSVLFHNNRMGQVSDQNSYQLGNFQYKMPSQLLAVERRRGEIDDKSPGHHSIRYTTPSLLLYQELLRRQNLDASYTGYGVPMQDAHTKMKSRAENEEYDCQKNATPSPTLEKSNKVIYASQSSPHLDYQYPKFPSQMLARNIVQETPENVTQGYELPGNVSPSELFNRIQALENGRSKPSEHEVHQYLRTPNPILQMHMYRPYETEHIASDGEYRYAAPSRLLEVMDQRRPAEPMTSKASSSRSPHPGDHNKYNEQNVRIEYINPARFFQKREDQARISKIPKDEAFINSTPLRPVDLDDTTIPGQKPSPSAVLRDFDLEGQEEEAILYEREYDSFVAADRNGNANNNVIAESSVDPDCEMNLETIQNASIASSQKSESKVPAAVQYTLAQSFNNSESKGPAAVQYTLAQSFNNSESKGPAAVQYTLAQSFNNSESKGPAAVQYTLAQSFNNSESKVPVANQNASTAGFNKSDSEVPPTIQNLSDFNKSECTAAATIKQQASSESFSKLENEVEHAEIIHRLMVVLGNTAVFLAAYTEQEIISLLTLMKTGQKKKSNTCSGKGNGPAGSSIQREGCGSIAPFLGNQEVKEPHHVAWMTSICTLKVLKASLTSKSEADLYQVLVDIHSLLACANSFMKEHGNISLDALIRSESDYRRSISSMDVAERARRMSEPYQWFFSEEFVQTTTLQEFLNMIQNTPQIERSHIVLRTKPFRNVRGSDVNSAEMTVPFQDSVHIQGLFSSPVHQSRTNTSDSQIKHLQHQQKINKTVNLDFSPWDISNISNTPPNTRNSVIWQNRDGSLSQSVSDFPDFRNGKLPKTLESKRGSAFSLVINPSFNLSSDEEDFETVSKWDTAKGQIVSSPEIKKYKTNKKLFKQGAGKDKSPDEGQRLYGSSLGLNWQSDGKKGRGGGRPETSPDARNIMMEKELILSQNRKLQGEINTLQTENKLLKEKYNRIKARIAEIENEMQVTQSELETLLETSNQEIIELTNSSRLANQKDKEQFQSKISALAKENESFKLETASLEKQVESYRKLLDTVRHAGEKSKLLEAQTAELIAVKEQLGNTREHLEQREQHFHKEEEQHNETRKQVQKLTELKDLLQQQSGATDDEAVIDKQIQSLEKRLKVTEERLFQERADRANNLSQVEEKLLAENAQFQVIESDLSRKLQREKEKNRNLEKNIKDLREEIEKLHLALPFDESLLTLKKGNYSIPNSSHSSARAESLRSNDMNYIMAQINKEDGLGAGQEQDIIRELWNKRKLAYMQLHELEIQLVELGISDNIADGLKNLRDNYGQAETKMKQMEERLSDMQFEMAALENTYKQQLTALVHERHDAFAHLKTAEDLLEALKTENQSLRLSLTGSQSATAHQNGSNAGRNAETELLRSEVQSLGSHLERVISRNNLLEGELKMVNVQLNSQNLALQESKEELELLYASLKDNEASNSQQQKIDRLSAQVNDLNAEIAMLNDRNNTLLSEKEKLEDTLAASRKKEISLQKIKQQQKANIAQIEDLREELNEKEHKIENQKWQLNELDGQLQKVRQDLYRELEHTDELETEVDSLQQTVTQRAQMFETLIGSEQEQLAQFQLLKDTLDSVSKKLDEKKAKVSSLELNLSLSKNRVEDLERDLKELRQERSYDTKFHPSPQSSMGDRLRIRELEGERTTLKHEMAQLHSTVQLTKEQTYQAQKDIRQLESELVKAKTTILQLTAEKHELEQHLEQIAEENDSLIQERGQAEEDLVKLEKKLQEILEKFEQEARKQHGNFETRYVNIPADSRKLLNELDSLRLLLEGKEREAEMIQDRSMRQQMEVNFLQKKVELIQNQMISNREDIVRMVNELANKMKEAVRTREVNQFLVHERTKLQTENYHLEKGLEKEMETKVQMKKEIEEITKKIEMSQVQSKNTEKEAQDKDNLIATMEADLRNATRNLTHLELEVNQQKNKIERLNNDVKNLAKINSTLEKRLETEKNTLAEEKETSRRWKDDLTNMNHKLEMLQHEHQLAQDKLATEQQTVEKLRNQSQSYHEECEQLKEEVTAHKNHVDILRGQVLLGKDDLEKLKQEKDSLRREYEVLCRQLNDKENELELHREESLHKLDSIQRELNEEKTTLENNKTLLEKELDFTRSELESLKEKLHHKEIQLQSFVKTLQELEVVTREKRVMEANIQRLEGLVRDNKVILDGQRKEIMVHMEANSKHQEMLAKAEMTNQKLYGELRIQQENSQHEIHQLQITIKELHSQHEAERSALSESLNQSQSQLQSSQSHLALAADARDKLQGRVRILERDLEEIKSKLSDESTGRHLTEHSVGSLRLQLEDTRNQKIVAEARLNEMEKALTKTESQLKVEKEKLRKLSGRIQETEISNHSVEFSVKAKQEQVDLLQNENSKLRQMLEGQKQSLISKMKMTTLDIKQQLEMVQNERDKMSSEMQKLLVDLEQSREQIAMKNKENYKQQEEILVLEDQVKECKFKLKAAEDSLKTETAVQDQLTHRYAEQEEELKVLKNFLAKKAEESGDADKAMWHEMNHVIQELSRQMQSHLESQKQNKDARETPTQIQKLKRQIMDLQGELATERSLHQITRDSLQALEEDCKRLRHQLHVLRRRESSVSDKKYKNRMEAINAIIAKSQSQAQALLATGGYHDDINSPIYSPRMGYRSQSPRMGYSSPQRAFSPDNSVASEFSIASTGPMVPTFESSAPHTSQGRRN